MKRFTKALSMLLMILMVVSLLPLSSIAEDIQTMHTVVFKLNYNGAHKIPSQKVADGECAVQPEDVTREGWIFKYWYVKTGDGIQKFDLTQPITEDVTLYARWDEDLTHWGPIWSRNILGATADNNSNDQPDADEIPGEITRGQWIKMLVAQYGYPYDVTGALETFADVENSAYRSAIETAVVNGILNPAPQENFDPDRIATREFAAETAVKSMGYSPEGTIECDDVEEIEDPAAANQAIASGLLTLENNKFYPKRALRKAEAENILAAAEKEFNTVDADTNTLPGFVFLDGVVHKDEDAAWETDGEEMIVPAGEDIPAVGQIITFGTKKAIRVESVKTDGGETRITYSTPTLPEFLDRIDTAGEAVMDFSNFVPAEGVTVTYNSASQVQPLGFMDDWFDVPSNEIDVNGEVELSGEIDLGDNWEIGYALTVSIPTVAYKFDIDFDFNPFSKEPLANVKNAYIKFQEDIDVHVDFGRGIDTGDDEFDDSVFDDIIDKEIPIGSIPLVGVDGLCVEVEVDLIFTASGKVVVDYNVHGTVGCQVLNNKLKNISALSSSLSVGLEAEFSAGPKIGLEAEVFGKDILEFSIEAGANAGGSVHLRYFDPDPICDMVCMDATAYAYAHINALEECLIDDWLDIGMKFTIWDDDNSPFKISGHWEDMIKVPECTYNEKGTIKGTVANADDRTQYISNAKINILKHETFDEETTVYSNGNGEYTATVPANSYLVKISADGYIPFESLETVAPNDTVYLETYLMVEGDEDSGETSTIGGQIANSVTGIGIPGVKLTIRKGWNKTSGDTVATASTNSAGTYSATLPLGNFTILMECDGYVTGHFNVAVTKNGNNNCHAVMTPDGSDSVALGDMRIILTWGTTPYDLDSHLWGPTVDGESMYHIYYNSMSYINNGNKQAYLDVDDRVSYGPETTTIYDMTPNGVYSFYVHDYTNRSSTASNALANSGAKVQVYMGNALIATYNIPTSRVGTVWHVFDFDATTGKISGVNTFTSTEDPGIVGKP